MDYTMTKTRKAAESSSDRDRVIAYLRYAVDDVAVLSASSASLLVAAIDDLQQAKKAHANGNDLRNPS